jgi:hypothetical protein
MRHRRPIVPHRQCTAAPPTVVRCRPDAPPPMSYGCSSSSSPLLILISLHTIFVQPPAINSKQISIDKKMYLETYAK